MQFLSRFSLHTSLGLAILGTVAPAAHAQSTLPQITIKDANVREGNSGQTPLVFKVELSRNPTSLVTVSYRTFGRTASGTSDFVNAQGTVSFAPGVKSKTITIQVKGDTKPEANETFLVKLTGPKASTLRDGEATGTIVNDDGEIKSSAGNGRITFASSAPGIFIVNSDGTNRTQLTSASGDAYPTWSPDGKKIAYRTSSDAAQFNYGLTVINANGKNPVVVTSGNDFYNFYQPIWSSDSMGLLYNDFATSRIGLVKAPIDGSAPITLTTNNSDYLPTAGSNGKIAFLSYSGEENLYQIYTINSDGSERTQLTNDRVHAISAPRISANGRTIVYLKDDAFSTGVWVIDSNGKNERLVFEIYKDGNFNNSSFINPVISDDGKKVAMMIVTPRDVNGRTKSLLYVGDVTTSVVKTVELQASYVDFSTDGKSLVFASSQDGYSQIYTISSDLTKQTRVTRISASDYLPDMINGTVPAPQGGSNTTILSPKTVGTVKPSANKS